MKVIGDVFELHEFIGKILEIYNQRVLFNIEGDMN